MDAMYLLVSAYIYAATTLQPRNLKEEEEEEGEKVEEKRRKKQNIKLTKANTCNKRAISKARPYPLPLPKQQLSKFPSTPFLLIQKQKESS